MQIFIINLESQTDKRAFMQEQLDKLGLEAEFIPAVNGKAMPLDKLKAATIDYEHNGLTAGEIGCALSHISIYKKMVHDHIDQALILEDDALLSPDLASVLNQLKASSLEEPMAYLLTTPEIYTRLSTGI